MGGPLCAEVVGSRQDSILQARDAVVDLPEPEAEDSLGYACEALRGVHNCESGDVEAWGDVASRFARAFKICAEEDGDDGWFVALGKPPPPQDCFEGFALRSTT
eukprot:CAMPEP_0171110758 /NCGR_PEP_ID=MMETSP0766_2-20121228/72520_1 /TAXON_ID=439317 /ORGANISM="Gambierdiscus australes, Strain CAWD 149" /LENGTH=103 /DNA_ID=CAMNT_0011572677 /DNA_START=40 /DNA_END=351 /DNA_ORIENTATION=-